jgi:DNA-binding response OmpR family regulator
VELLADTPTVLLVERDTALRRVIALGLQHQGISVLEAASAQQARALMEQHPSLLILDVDSDLAGDRALLPELRTYDGLARTPVVVLTWDCSPELTDQLESDATAVCLAKPFDARHLFTEVATLLEAAQRRRMESAVAAVIGQSILAPSPEVAVEVLQDAPRAALVEMREEIRTSSPSIWPVVLALGMTLAASGFLIHPALVVLGVLVILGSMLLWGFEPSARPGEA